MNSVTTAERSVKSSILMDATDVKEAISVLRAQPGVTRAELGGSAEAILVTYDLTRHTYGHLIEVLNAGHLIAPLSFWQRVRSSWLTYQDTNLRGNAGAAVSPCCSNPTSITGSARRN